MHDQDHSRPASAAARDRVMKGLGLNLLRVGVPDPERVPVEGTPDAPAALDRSGASLGVIAASRSLPRDESWADLVQDGTVVEPPYDPWSLVCTVEESDTLPALIDAVATNVSGYGVELVPLFPKRDPETGEPVAPPAGAEAERETLELFLATCDPEHGFAGVIDLADRDRETVGWSTIEILRNKEGVVSALQHVRSYATRLGKLSPQILVDVPVRAPSGEIVTVPRWRRFRTIVQIVDDRRRFFKQFGDPRHVNCNTGAVRPPDGQPWVGTDGSSEEATEVLYQRIYAPHTDYGVPRWIGASPHVRAAREAGELIVRWFRNAPIGAKLLTVSGGALVPGSLKKLTKDIADMGVGSKNAFGLVAVEAEGQTSGDSMDDSRPVPPRLELADLAYVIPEHLYQGDGNLIDGGRERVARMFRLPPLYLGASQDYSRAAVSTARAFAEEQVFVPLREKVWHRWFRAELLPALGINHWTIELRGASTTDDTEVAAAVDNFEKAISPNAMIRAWNKLTGQDEQPITEPWGDRPVAVTLALLEQGLDPNAPLADVAAQFAEDRQRSQDAADAAAEALRQGGGQPNDPNAPGVQDAPPERAQKSDVAGAGTEVARILFDLGKRLADLEVDDEEAYG